MSTNKERLIKNNQDLNNIKTQVHNLPEYLDTSDATATENDLLQGKTAYVNGKKLVGIYEGSSGSGEVKKFDTIEDMQQDENPQEGDLAVVYSNQQSNMTENSVFSKITLPQTVVLDTAVEDYIEIGFQPVDESVEMDCWGNLDSNRMNVDIYMMSEGTDYRIQYESQDGITYIRSGETPEEIDFGFDVKFGNRWGEAQWDDRIGQFFIIGQVNFNGLFQYKLNIKDESKLLLKGLNDFEYDESITSIIDKGTYQFNYDYDYINDLFLLNNSPRYIYIGIDDEIYAINDGVIGIDFDDGSIIITYYNGGVDKYTYYKYNKLTGIFEIIQDNISFGDLEKIYNNFDLYRNDNIFVKSKSLLVSRTPR